ncbi:MAG TPA: NfeD family protein [Verrucomicrobiae bacterium]|nr:NfeD family protein [Verrucomicrobiae bacterium]
MAIVILTVTGMVLIAVDFYLPGFVLGSIGVVLMLVATGVCYSATESFSSTIILFCGEVVLGIGAGYASVKYFPKTAAGRKMILSKTQAGERAQSQQPNNNWVGRRGVAQTVLRPAGMALIDGERHDVVAESGMIESGSPIKIVAVHENQLVVTKLK